MTNDLQASGNTLAALKSASPYIFNKMNVGVNLAIIRPHSRLYK